MISAVLLLTVADILLTYLGLHHGYLAELNPLMRYVLESPGYLKFLLLTLYLALPFALLYRYAEAVSWMGIAMAVLLVIKIVIMVQHAAIVITLLAWVKVY